MKQKHRKYIVWLLILLFFIITPPTILYSQGYRFDIANKKISSTGGLFIKANPKSANIFLDEVLLDKTDFFFGSVLIEELMPKQYRVLVKKQGYHPWEKTLGIKEKQVNDAKNITLVQEEIVFSALSENVKNYYFFGNKEKILIQENEKTNIATTTNWSLKLFDISKNIKSHLISDRKLIGYQDTGEQIILSGIKFSDDENLVLAEIDIAEETQYMLVNLEKNNIKSEKIDFLNKARVDKIWFSPENREKIFYLSDNNLFEKDISEKSISYKSDSSPVLMNIMSCDITQGNVYYLDAVGEIIKTDFLFQTKEKLLKDSFALNPSGKYNLEIYGNSVFLSQDSILYWLNPRDKTFEKILDNAKGIILSPDGKKICYFNNYEIWILFLESQREEPKREQGEKMFLTRFSKQITDIFWWTNHYLIFTSEQINSAPFESKKRGIRIMEIDNRDKTNTYVFAESENPDIFWNDSDKKLYVLDNGTLYCSEELIR